MPETTQREASYPGDMDVTAFSARGILIVIIIGVSLLSINAFSSVRTANATTTKPLTYNCSTSHCYGTADWPGPAINGSYTDISVEHLSCPAPQCSYSNADFIDDEMWLRDENHQASSCPKYKVGCWVEGGIIAVATSPGSGTTVSYFWADYRPSDGSRGLHFHYIGAVPSGDYGHVTTFDFYRTASSNCNTSPQQGTFELDIYSETHSYTELSQNNCMTPDTINIGQEMQGTSGASAPRADFTNNIWVSTNNVAHFQTSNPSTPTPNAPVQDSLVVPPSQSSSGGDFATWCTC